MVALKPKHRRINPSTVAWVALAVFFIVFGVLFYLNSLGINPLPDSEFLEAAGANDLPIGAVSDSSLTISRYGSFGFIIVGVLFLILAGLTIRES